MVAKQPPLVAKHLQIGPKSDVTLGFHLASLFLSLGPQLEPKATVTPARVPFPVRSRSGDDFLALILAWSCRLAKDFTQPTISSGKSGIHVGNSNQDCLCRHKASDAMLIEMPVVQSPYAVMSVLPGELVGLLGTSTAINTGNTWLGRLQGSVSPLWMA